MKKVIVIMPNGDKYEIDESQLSEAVKQGAKLYNPVVVSKGSDKYEIDESFVNDAVSQGATIVKKKDKQSSQSASQNISKDFQDGIGRGTLDGLLDSNKNPTVVTRDGVSFDVSIPMFMSPSVVEQIQTRVKEGRATNEDVAMISSGSKKSTKAVSEYLKSREDGITYEEVEKSEKNKADLSKGLSEISSFYSTNTADEIMNDVGSAKKFMESFESESAPKKREDTLIGDDKFVEESEESYSERADVKLYRKKKELYDRVAPKLRELQSRNTLNKFISGSLTKDQAIGELANIADPVTMRQIEDSKTSQLVRDVMPSSTFNIAPDLYRIRDWMTGSKEKNEEIFNSVKGRSEVAFNNYLLSVGAEMMHKANQSGNENLKKQITEKVASFDEDAIYKYPTLIEQEITSSLTDYISRVAGSKKGSTTESVLLKIYGDSFAKYAAANKFFAEEGAKWMNNPKSAEVAKKVLKDILTSNDKVGEVGLVEGVGRSVAQPFVDMWKGVGDLTGIRSDADLVREKINESLFPTEAPDLKDWVSTARNISNTTANVVGQGLAQFALGGAGRVAGLSKAAAKGTGFWLSGALPAYDQAYKQSMDFIDDAPGRTLYSLLVAGFTGASEKLFPEVKLIDNIPGVKSAFAKLASKAGTKELTEQLYKETTDEAKNAIVNYVAKYVKNVGQESLEEVATQVFTDMSKIIFGDPNTDAEELFKNAKDTFIQTVIGTSIIGGWGAYGDVRNEKNSTYKSQLYNAAIFHDEAEDALLKGYQNKSYTKNEYNEKVQTLNTARTAYAEMKGLETSTGKKLNQQQAQVYVANRTAEALIQKQIDDIDSKGQAAGVESNDSIKQELQLKLDNLKSQRNRIFGEDVKFDETLREEVKSDVARSNEDVVKEAVSFADDIQDQSWKTGFLANPEVALKEVAQQLHGTTAEADGANKTFGKRISELALEAYPTKESASGEQQNKVEPEAKEDVIPISETMNKKVTYKGNEGTMFRDEETDEIIFSVAGTNKEYVLGKTSEVSERSIKDFGIEQINSVVSTNDTGDVVVRGGVYKNNYSDPLAAINRDESGNIVSVNLETEDGKKRTFRGNVAEDIAYEITLKEINKDNETRQQLEDFINSDEAISTEINNAASESSAKAETVADNASVQREKIEPKQPQPTVTIEGKSQSPSSSNTPKEEVVKLSDLPDRAFAVGMDKEKADRIKKQLSEEGFTQPIIIDKESGNVLDGQSRLMIAEGMGIKEVPAIYMDNPTRGQLNDKIKELEKQKFNTKEQVGSGADENKKDDSNNISTTVAFAPFKEGDISDISDSGKAFENKKYIRWRKMAEKFASDLGITIDSQSNSVGVYGETSSDAEASAVLTVTGTKDKIDLFSALMGVLAPDSQHSVMRLIYEKNGNASEYRIAFNTNEDAISFVNSRMEFGIKDISLLSDSNTVIVLDFGSFNNDKLSEEYGAKIKSIEERNFNGDSAFEINENTYEQIIQGAIQQYDGTELGKSIADTLRLAKERSGRLGSSYNEKSEQAKIASKKAVDGYISKNKKLGIPELVSTVVDKVDAEFAKEISDDYSSLPTDDSSNPEVASSYNDAVKEINLQYEYLTKDLGLIVEFVEEDPYPNSESMFEDIVKNNHLRVYKGGEPHPFLGESSKDVDGITANEKLRVVHDYFGHFVNRNQFGQLGEERAWVDHSKMFTPNAQRAITTETRGQNSFVNFSGVNDEAKSLFEQGHKLISEGKVAEGNKLISEGKSKFKFAEQKVALLPIDKSDWSKYVVVDKKKAADKVRKSKKNKPPKDTNFQGVEINAQNIESVDPDEASNDVEGKILSDLKKIIPVLEKLVPGVKVKIFKTDNEFRKEVGSVSSGGWSQKNKTMYFNLESISRRKRKNTVYHEAVHPIMNALHDSNPSLVRSLAGQIRGLADQFPEIQPVVDYGLSQGAQYGSNEIGDMETVVEFIASISNGDIKLPESPEDRKTFIGKIISIINDFLKLIGSDLRLDSSKSYTDIIDVARDISELFKGRKELTVAKIPLIRNDFQLQGDEGLGVSDKDYDDSLDEVAKFIEQNDKGTFEQAAEAGYEFLKSKGYKKINKKAYVNKILSTIYDTDHSDDNSYYQGMGEEEKAQYDSSFKKSGSKKFKIKPSLRERIENVEPATTGDKTKYSAAQTFKEAGYGNRGRVPQGETTTVASIVDATLNFINEVNEEEGGDGVRAIMEYLGFDKNRRKGVKDIDTNNIRTNKHFSLVNVLFGYIKNTSPTELGLSLQESNAYSKYLKKLSFSLGRTVGQDLNTAKLRNVTESLLSDMVLNTMMSDNESIAMDEFDQALEKIIDGEDEFTDDELSEPGIIETEEEIEKQIKQSAAIQKAMEQEGVVSKLKNKPVTEKMSKKISDKIKIAEEKLRSLINSINCD